MIISASRRTDIPAFYSKWFMERLRSGYLMVRNPMNYHQVSKVSLASDVCDCIVFWTKNAAPLIPFLPEIAEKIPFYFQYTINGYGRDIEPHLPDLASRINSFKEISDEGFKAIWRYDPIFISEKYTVDWHISTFSTLCEKISKYTDTCVFSFIDMYDKIKKSADESGIRCCTAEEKEELARCMSAIGKRTGITLKTCAEDINLEKYSIEHGCCIDGNIIEKITGCRVQAKKDPNQREECGCIESIDIGQYNTCRHGCKYCYATFNPQSVVTLSGRHNPLSPLLVGEIEEGDKVTERKMKSLLNRQQSFF